MLNRILNMKAYGAPELTSETPILHFFHWSNEIEKNRIHEKAYLEAAKRVGGGKRRLNLPPRRR